MKKLLLLLLLIPTIAFSAEPTVPAGVLFFDNQAYSVNPVDLDAPSKFSGAGWTTTKLCNNTVGVSYPPIANCAGLGFMYTATSTPGINKTIPGNGRALAIEVYEGTLGGQSDLYIGYGSPSDNVGHVPADVWYQFWYLGETSGSWNQYYGKSKFIYPNKTSGPGNTCSATGDCDWLVYFGSEKMLPHQADPASTDGTQYFKFWHDREVTPGVPATRYGTVNQCADSYWYGKFGYVNDNVPLTPGDWYQVRIHINGSSAAFTAGRQLYELYIRKYGDAEFTLVARWQNGQDYAPGVGGGCTATWEIDSTTGYGSKGFIIPSTQGNAAGGNSNIRYYLKDFSMAAGTDSGGLGVDDLPYGYGDAGPDTTPAAFSFTDNTGVARSTVIYSTSVQVAGIDNTTSIALSGTGCEYRVNAGSWITSGDNVALNDNVALRVTSSGSYSTNTPCTLTLNGNVSDVWNATTLAAVLDPVAPRFRGSSMSGGWR